MKKITLSLVFVLFFLFLTSLSSALASKSFDVDKPFIYAVVEQGEVTDISFSVLNNAKLGNFVFSSFSTNPFFKLDKSSSSIDSGASFTNKVVLGATSLMPGVYVGSIEVYSGEDSIIIPVVLEVQSSKVLFDASIRELPSFAHIPPGSDFSPELVLYNLRSLDNKAELSYALYDLHGNKVIERKQFVDVKNTLELAVSLPLDANLAEGDYVFAADIRSASSVGTISSLIHVDYSLLASPSVKSSNTLLSYAFAAVIFLLIAFLLVNYLWRRRVVADASYWDQQLKSVKKGSDVRRSMHKLVYQRHLLEEAYGKKYVTLATYNKTKSRIDVLIRNLKKRL